MQLPSAEGAKRRGAEQQRGTAAPAPNSEPRSGSRPHYYMKAILFDLDGTLIDSVELIARSARHAFEACGERVPADAEWLADLGMPLRTMFRRFVDEEARLERLIAGYREFQHANHDLLVRPYAEVTATLDRLTAGGYRLAIVTSKVEHLAVRGLELVGLGGRFETIVGLDACTNHKPHPEPVETALARMQLRPEDAVFVGDSPHDMAAGRAAGVRTAAALWGPFTREQIAPTGPDWWLETISDLPPLLGLARPAA